MTMNGKLMEQVRAVVRPIITLSGWAFLLYAFIVGLAVAEWFWTTVVSLTVWWFADRKQEGRVP